VLHQTLPLPEDISSQNLPSHVNPSTIWKIFHTLASLMEEGACQRCARIYARHHSCFELAIELEPFGMHRATFRYYFCSCLPASRGRGVHCVTSPTISEWWEVQKRQSEESGLFLLCALFCFLDGVAGFFYLISCCCWLWCWMLVFCVSFRLTQNSNNIRYRMVLTPFFLFYLFSSLLGRGGQNEIAPNHSNAWIFDYIFDWNQWSYEIMKMEEDTRRFRLEHTAIDSSIEPTLCLCVIGSN
jgi:hypothetical protein